MKLSEIQATPRLKLSQVIDNKVISEPSYKYKDFGIAGLPGLNLGRGMTAVKRGADIRDIPGLVAKTASGYGFDFPERMAERPFKFALAGPLGSSLKGTPPESLQLPFPRPITEEGKKLGGELEKYGAAAGVGELTSSIVPFAKMGYNFLKLKSLGGPSGAIKKAEDKFIQILQPQVKKLDIASKKGFESPESIKKSISFVKPSKTFEELASNLGQTKKKVIQSRNQIIRGENYRVGNEYLIPLQDEINALKREPQTESIQREIMEMEKTLNSYLEFNEKKGFNRIQAQAHKERLQKETEPLLKRLAAGESIQRSPHEIKALDKVRFGLMKMVEGGNPEVKRLNESFAALKETEVLARHQANLARKTTPTLLEKIPVVRDVLQAVARSRAYPEQVALRALNIQPSLGRQTKDIAKLFELSQLGIKKSPITGEIKYGKPRTALQVAYERLKKK